MLVAVFAAAVALVGLLVFAFAGNPNFKTIGLACFTAGLAACLVMFGGPTLRIP